MHSPSSDLEQLPHSISSNSSGAHQELLTTIEPEDSKAIVDSIIGDDADKLIKLASKYSFELLSTIKIDDLNNPLYFAILNNKVNSIKALIKHYGVDIALTQKDKIYEYDPVFFAIYNEKTESLKALIDACGLDKVLDQKYQIYLSNPISFAFLNKKKQSFATLISMLPNETLLNMNDSFGNNLILDFIKCYISSNKKPQFKELLDILSKKVFGEEIEIGNKLSILSEFHLHYSYLMLGHSDLTFLNSRKSTFEAEEIYSKFFNPEK